MLLDDLRDQLKSVEPELDSIKKCYANAKLAEQFEKLEQVMHDENFWKNPG